ncbi:hypothetical protein RhiirA5_496077 [Rhizophagus irregularis]|uniref:Uncharacterized protein n=2 Tax=Rhizophagus irregularis TaxID=588596 RepID=A0A2N0RSE1_9GLOM|nr:hypothetical protein GLOIN_2v1874254 [Rhizophagus irregularis DAOM 181602=DAOM 197198]PKC13513.1 hypothetical protein RhiirA5_496077 [Rhizophagus irregularis]PKC66220.1 hypothetical protein RhiirA1_535789 [Rhizophagus irregularis]POG73643.1 hypothetical protein GLOIN_2v1874254 [Rhizophagus irregularis DAOM 181602=DAOM 197198]|eukprot:XP_025180509.1 hypothetical protein GLOIN_2v1874254 [Rhizophagus irregularis DAOM 181602=DAOM 197198]
MEEDKTALSFLNTNLLPITSIPDNNIVDKSFQLVNQNKHINANESSVDNIIKSDDEEIHDDALDFDLSKEVNKVDTDIKNGDPNFHYGRKSNNNGSKRLNQGKKSKRSFENMENIDPQTIPPRKKEQLKRNIRQQSQ